MSAPQIVNDPGIPPNWTAVYDAVSGKRYYWNQSNNETTYRRPTGGNDRNGSSFFGQENDHTFGEYKDTSHLPDPDEQPNFTSGSKEAKTYRDKTEMTVQGTDIPDPFLSFEDAKFPRDIMREIDRAGFTEPTPIQAQSWSIALQGRDVVGIAKTGSGKTCGYMLPGLMHIRSTNKSPREGPTVLVLAPTRELANQIKEETDKFGHSAGISNTCLYGGAARGPQMRDIRNGIHVAIATPGRLNDFLEAGQISLGQVSYLVLDEADRMLDMGFEPQIQQIVRYVPDKRQTLFYSATWPKEVRKIASQFVRSAPVHVFIGSTETVANKDIEQMVEVVQGFEKNRKVDDFLRSLGRNAKVLIFCGTKRMCDNLSQELRPYGATAIHGDKTQDARDHTLRHFKQGSKPIMCATDVAARGLDVPNVDAVINYDFPSNIEDYVHRIGRTGRAGAKGKAYSLMTDKDSKLVKPLIKIIKEAGQTPPSELERMPAGGGGGAMGRGRGGPGFAPPTRGPPPGPPPGPPGGGERGKDPGREGGRERSRNRERSRDKDRSSRDKGREKDNGRNRSRSRSRGKR